MVGGCTDRGRLALVAHDRPGHRALPRKAATSDQLAAGDSDEERANGATLRQIAKLRKDVAEMSVATRSNRATDHRKMCKRLEAALGGKTAARGAEQNNHMFRAALARGVPGSLAGRTTKIDVQSCLEVQPRNRRSAVRYAGPGAPPSLDVATIEVPDAYRAVTPERWDRELQDWINISFGRRVRVRR